MALICKCKCWIDGVNATWQKQTDNNSFQKLQFVFSHFISLLFSTTFIAMGKIHLLMNDCGRVGWSGKRNSKWLNCAMVLLIWWCSVIVGLNYVRSLFHPNWFCNSGMGNRSGESLAEGSAVINWFKHALHWIQMAGPFCGLLINCWFLPHLFIILKV